MATKIAVINAQFIIRLWDVIGYPSYFFGNDKQLYRYDRRGQLKKNKRVVIGTTQGYILKRKFFSLAQLRLLLHRHDSTSYPVGF